MAVVAAACCPVASVPQAQPGEMSEESEDEEAQEAARRSGEVAALVAGAVWGGSVKVE